MALIKKIDVEEYFAARRAMRLGRERRVSQTSAAGSGPTKKAASPPLAVGNLSQGDSSSSVSFASLPITSNPVPNRLLRPPGSRQR